MTQKFACDFTVLIQQVWDIADHATHFVCIRQCLPNLRHDQEVIHQCFQLPIDKEWHALGIKQRAIKCALGLCDLLSCTVNWFEKSSAILDLFYKGDSLRACDISKPNIRNEFCSTVFLPPSGDDSIKLLKMVCGKNLCCTCSKILCGGRRKFSTNGCARSPQIFCDFPESTQ